MKIRYFIKYFSIFTILSQYIYALLNKLCSTKYRNLEYIQINRVARDIVLSNPVNRLCKYHKPSLLSQSSHKHRTCVQSKLRSVVISSHSLTSTQPSRCKRMKLKTARVIWVNIFRCHYGSLVSVYERCESFTQVAVHISTYRRRSRTTTTQNLPKNICQRCRQAFSIGIIDGNLGGRFTRSHVFGYTFVCTHDCCFGFAYQL